MLLLIISHFEQTILVVNIFSQQNYFFVRIRPRVFVFLEATALMPWMLRTFKLFWEPPLQVLQTKNAVELCDHTELGDCVKCVFVRREMNTGMGFSRYLKAQEKAQSH